jgi:hypothetical protein
MVNANQLLKDLQRLLPKLEADIRDYAETHAEIGEKLQTQYAAAKNNERTAESWLEWRNGQITQAAVAWVLACVFTRFLEDNGLLREAWLAGRGARLQEARDRLAAYFQENPHHAERDYLFTLFAELQQYPALKALLDPAHNPLWQTPLSSDGAKQLIDFFQEIEPASGDLRRDFSDPAWNTRFLGDLYQDLSEAVRKRYALLQTPEFVEDFILDHTLQPAIGEFGLDAVRMIDPTCGSGHFLLGAFQRLFAEWQRREPGANPRALAQKALDAVHGVDVNPYAVAIARFRLLIAALQVDDNRTLNTDFSFSLAVGDSLLHGKRQKGTTGEQLGLYGGGFNHFYASEDAAALRRILEEKKYHAVVGNPPYITVKDKALNQLYRLRYSTCHRKYSLAVPFAERFFDLCLPAANNRAAGFVGMITANSFMKREFGKPLIEKYLKNQDLSHVIDTSGAYIPGHGTPTVILVARHQAPKTPTLRAVLGIRGEPSTPDDPAQGLVWRSIVDLLARGGGESEFVTVADQERLLFSTHPWSLGGGGASELKEFLEESADKKLKDFIDVIGFGAILGEDEAFGIPPEKIKACRLPEHYRPLIEGELVRDWQLESQITVLFPYDKDIELLDNPEIKRWLWPLRTVLWSRGTFGKQTYKDAGRTYYEYHQIPKERNKTPLSIPFAFVATHNHFVLDRGGKVFKQSAPVIKLPPEADEAEHLAMLGVLNSSVACFWLKQVFHNKGGGGIGGGLASEEWEQFYEFTGTGLKNFPIPAGYRDSAEYAERLSGSATLQSSDENTGTLERATPGGRATPEEAIAHQEELDWLCYRLYGLTDEDLCHPDPPPLQLGERAFEIALARNGTQTTWFARHKSTPITELPAHWPADYRAVVERRLAVIAKNHNLALIEKPEYKRRWNRPDPETLRQNTLRTELLALLEAELSPSDSLLSCHSLADRAARRPEFQNAAQAYTGTDMFDPAKLTQELALTDAVPAYAAARYKGKGLEKFAAWQQVWDLQRREDAGEAVGEIPLPPKYASADFKKSSFWKLRGKLDVPKERFFSLPGSDHPDGTPILGWAGWNHLQRAQRIAAYYMDLKDQHGAERPRLLPLLDALEELLPWLKQWHNDIDPEYGERMGEYFAAFVAEERRGE